MTTSTNLGQPRGKLFLIPVPMGSSTDTAMASTAMMPPQTIEIAQRLSVFIVENAKSARAALKLFRHPQPLQALQFMVLDEHTKAQTHRDLIAPLLSGQDVGLMSEAGCPGVADPGAVIVRLAHAHSIQVVPLVGPSSVLLALMASGLDGQRFAFSGYLPVPQAQRDARIKILEQRSAREKETQILIETPYRNASTFTALLQACRDDTLLCVARDLTGAQECIGTASVAQWRQRQTPALDKTPTVFLLLAVPGKN